MIYLDNAATSPVDGEVLEAMLPYLKEEYAKICMIKSCRRLYLMVFNRLQLKR